jgi:hypothetical protein
MHSIVLYPSAFKLWTKTYEIEDIDYDNVFKLPLWKLASYIINGDIEITQHKVLLTPEDALHKIYKFCYMRGYKRKRTIRIQ